MAKTGIGATLAVAALAGPALATDGTAAADAAAYVARIEQLDRQGPTLRSVLAVNPDWRAQAAALDRETQARRQRSPLHGRAILVKDNIETADRMPTTAGSLALLQNYARADAPLVARLRAAGGLVLGKTNLSEWANIRSTRSMSGWSAVGGLVRNPYALDRTACGSSSGSGAAVAAGLAWAAIGTETDGSITCPASVNGLVGLKPTVGLVSRARVVPISATQDTAGPMATNVRDAALLLSAIAGSDPADPATAEANAHKRDYAAGLAQGIRGVRVGVLRDHQGEPATKALFEAALERLRAAGAELVEIEKTGAPEGLGDAELVVLLTELKVGMNAYLASTPPAVRTRSLADVIAFNRADAARELPFFGQELFEQAEATKGLTDSPYLKALATAQGGARATLDRLLRDNRVAMLVTPTYDPAWLSDPVHGDQYNGVAATALPAMAGYPHLTVPMGQVMQLPVGLSFIGPKWSEAALLSAGAAYERARGPLPGPRFLPTVAAELGARQP